MCKGWMYLVCFLDEDLVCESNIVMILITIIKVHTE